MIYILRHKDIPVCVFDLDKEVVSASINSNTADHLPLPLKRILHYPEEFVSENENGRIRLTESGCDLVDFWLNDRTIPAKRRNPFLTEKREPCHNLRPSLEYLIVADS